MRRGLLSVQVSLLCCNTRVCDAEMLAWGGLSPGAARPIVCLSRRLPETDKKKNSMAGGTRTRENPEAMLRNRCCPVQWCARTSRAAAPAPLPTLW